LIQSKLLVQETHSSHHQLDSQIKSLDKQLQEYRSMVEENYKTISDSLNSQKNEIQCILTNTDTKMNALKGEFTLELEEENSKVLASINIISQSCKSLENIVNGLKTEIESKHSAQEKTVSQLQESILSKEKIIEIIDEKQLSKYNGLSQEIKNVQEQIKSTLDKIESYSRNFDSMNETITEELTIIKSKQSILEDSLKNEISKVRQEINTKDESLQELKNCLEAQKSYSESNHEVIKKEIESITDSLQRKMKEDISKAKEEVEQKIIDVKSSTKELYEKLSDRVDENYSNIIQEIKEIETKSKEIKALIPDSDTISQIPQIQSLLSSLETKVNSLDESLEDKLNTVKDIVTNSLRENEANLDKKCSEMNQSISNFSTKYVEKLENSLLPLDALSKEIAEIKTRELQNLTEDKCAQFVTKEIEKTMMKLQEFTENKIQTLADKLTKLEAGVAENILAVKDDLKITTATFQNEFTDKLNQRSSEMQSIKEEITMIQDNLKNIEANMSDQPKSSIEESWASDIQQIKDNLANMEKKVNEMIFAKVEKDNTSRRIYEEIIKQLKEDTLNSTRDTEETSESTNETLMIELEHLFKKLKESIMVENKEAKKQNSVLARENNNEISDKLSKGLVEKIWSYHQSLIQKVETDM